MFNVTFCQMPLKIIFKFPFIFSGKLQIIHYLLTDQAIIQHVNGSLFDEQLVDTVFPFLRLTMYNRHLV